MTSSVLPRLPGQPETRWSNWAGNQRCSPRKIERPLTESQLSEIVRNAVAAGLRVRAVGSGHSFTSVACTSDILVSIEHLNSVHSIDVDNQLVTVDGGIELGQLNKRLAKAGLAMTNLGDIAYQSAAGAISTGTHGTGLGFGGLATQVRGLRIVTASGEVVDCSPDQNPTLFHSARVSMGALGIISQLTIAVEPAFNLHAVEGPAPFGEVIEGWDEAVRSNDHFEFYWLPGTDQAMTKANRRTQDPIAPMSRFSYMRDKIIGENVAFNAMCKVGRLRPKLIPRFNDMLVSSVGSAEYTDVSHKVFTSPRWVKFVEMEYSVPVDAVPQMLRRLDDAVRASNIDLLFPIEVRSAAGDDIPLSTASGRDSGYIAVHRARGLDYQPYFEMVEAIVSEHDGRPHWGKMHFQNADTLASKYPQWDVFQQARADYDPNGTFSNDYLDRVLGEVSA